MQEWLYKHIGEKRYNKRNELMEIIAIDDANKRAILVKFFDAENTIVRAYYDAFIKGLVRNPNGVHKSCGIGVIPNKTKRCKELQVYQDICSRCTESFWDDNPTYFGTKLSDDWMYYPNFYDWIIREENFQKWKNGRRWCIDKDIIKKGNKVYSSEFCCLVPNNVNTLFVKKDANRGRLPIGVSKNHERYMSSCSNPFSKNQIYFGTYDTPEEAFMAYKFGKEEIIRQVAKDEFSKGNISSKCYNAMMTYEVEITD